MYAAISADIVSSTSLSAEATRRLKQKTEALFATLADKYPGFHGRLIKGDYIECIMQDAQYAFRIALVIKTCIKSFAKAEKECSEKLRTYGVRMAIGIGQMRIVDLEQGIWDGDAIYMSGRTLGNMKSLNKGTLSIQTSRAELTPPLNAIAVLADAIINGLTTRQSEVVLNKLLGYKENDISQNIRISQSSVNKASSSAKWYSIEEALKYFEQIKFDCHE